MKRRKVLLSVMILALVLVLTLGLLVACNDDQKTQYTVTFKDGDTEVATVRVDEGKALTAEQIPAGPDHNGEEFDGWYLDDQLIEAGYTPTADVTVTAKYHTVTPPPPTQYTVTFSLGDNTDGAVPAPKTVNAGASITLPDAVEWSGHTFDGWYLGTEKHDAGSQYTVNSSVEFVAHYSTITPPPAYTITFLDPDGNQLGVLGVGQVTRTPEGQYFADHPLAMGSFFEGWFVWEDDAYGEQINPREYNEDESVVLKMKLTSLTSTTIDASYNGKWVVDDDEFGLCSFTTNGVTTTIMFAEGDEETVLGVFADPEGGYYLAVATEVENTYNYHRVKLEDNGTITMHYIPSDSEDYTVSSLTKLNSYTVSFDAGDGSGSMSAVLAYEGEYTLPAPRGLIAPDGLEFYGWNSNVDGDYTLYKAGDTFDLHAAVTFTAQWSKTVTYKFVLGDEYTGSTVLPDVTQFASDVLVMPQVDDWAGHYINIWTGYYDYDMTEHSGTYATAKKPGATYNQLGQFADITWVADWSEGSLYTVSYWINGAKTDVSLPEGSYIITNAPEYEVPEGYYEDNWYFAEADGTPTAQVLQGSAQVSENCSVVLVMKPYGTPSDTIEAKFRGTFRGTKYGSLPVVLVVSENNVQYVESGYGGSTTYNMIDGSKFYLTENGSYVVRLSAHGEKKALIITYVDATHVTIADFNESESTISLTKDEEKSAYDVTYFNGKNNDSYGITGDAPQATTAAPGATVTTLATSPWTRVGYDFLGWKVQSKNLLDSSQWDDISEYLELSAGDTFVMPANDVRIVARWDTEHRKNVTVKYNSNGGTGEMTDGTVLAENNITTQSNGFEHDGNYLFTGWGLTASGPAVVNEGDRLNYSDYWTYIVDDNGDLSVTLYAIWQEYVEPFYITEVGKWTGDGHELLILPQNCRVTQMDREFFFLCAVIWDGQYIEMTDEEGDGTLQGVLYYYYEDDDDTTCHIASIVISKTGEGNIQVHVVVTTESTSGSNEDSNDTYTLDSRADIHVDFENMDGTPFVGSYTAGSQTLEVAFDGGYLDVTVTDAEETELYPYAWVIDDYLVLYDYDETYMEDNSCFLAYVFTLKKDGDNLVGTYYTGDSAMAEKCSSVTFEPTPPPTSDSFTFTGSVEVSDMDGNEGTVTKIVLDSTTDPTTITVTVDGVDETITTIYDVTDIDGWYVILSSGMYLNFAIEGDTLTIYFDEDGDYSTDLGTLTLQA